MISWDVLVLIGATTVLFLIGFWRQTRTGAISQGEFLFRCAMLTLLGLEFKFGQLKSSLNAASRCGFELGLGAVAAGLAYSGYLQSAHWDTIPTSREMERRSWLLRSLAEGGGGDPAVAREMLRLRDDISSIADDPLAHTIHYSRRKSQEEASERARRKLSGRLASDARPAMARTEATRGKAKAEIGKMGYSNDKRQEVASLAPTDKKPDGAGPSHPSKLEDITKRLPDVLPGESPVTARGTRKTFRHKVPPMLFVNTEEYKSPNSPKERLICPVKSNGDTSANLKSDSKKATGQITRMRHLPLHATALRPGIRKTGKSVSFSLAMPDKDGLSKIVGINSSNKLSSRKKALPKMLQTKTKRSSKQARMNLLRSSTHLTKKKVLQYSINAIAVLGIVGICIVIDRNRFKIKEGVLHLVNRFGGPEVAPRKSAFYSSSPCPARLAWMNSILDNASQGGMSFRLFLDTMLQKWK